jgi:hypothetical protein
MDNPAIVPAGGRDDDNTGLLTDLDALRRRARDDRHAYAFPLFLFGALILLSPVLYASVLPLADGEALTVGPGTFPQFTSNGAKYPDLVGWYWVATIIGGLWATSWWYRRRARRHGVETDVRVPTVAAMAALVGFLAWEPLFGDLLLQLFDYYGGFYSTPAINLPILFGSAAGAVAAGLWSTRRTGWPRAAGVAVAVFLTTVFFGAVVVYLIRGYGALVIIAAALLALAWAERSALLAVVGGLFTGAALLVNLYDVDNVFDRLGWRGGWNDQVSTLQAMLLPGMILVVGGVVAVIRDRR